MKQEKILSTLVILMFTITGISSAQITDITMYREVIATIYDTPVTYPHVGELVFDSSENSGSFETDVSTSWEDGLCRTIQSSHIEMLDQTINISTALRGEISRSTEGEPNVFSSLNLVNVYFHAATDLNFWVEYLRDGVSDYSNIWLFDEETHESLFYLNSEEESGSWAGSFSGSGYYRMQIIHQVQATQGSEFATESSLDLSIIFSTDEVVSTEEKSWNAVKALYR